MRLRTDHLPIFDNNSEKDTHCEVCRAPAAAIPCERCALPEPDPVERSQFRTQSRPTHPILLEGKYKLLEEIGRGGMGTVFRARDQSLDRIVAVKLLLPEIQAMPKAVERFRREARAMASISQEHVVSVYDFGKYGEADFIVTEYIDGKTIDEYLVVYQRRNEQIDIDKALNIISQAAIGLDAVHIAGVVHRDIKPGNVMIESETNRVLIMDFGIGRRTDLEPEKNTMTLSGTPAYMSPETIANVPIERQKEYLVDIYALGVTAFEILTGNLPFDGDHFIEVLEKHIRQQPPAPSSFRNDLPAGLDEVILKCLEKIPDHRFQSAFEFKEALDPFLGARDTFVSVPPPEPRTIVVADRDPEFRDQVFRVSQNMAGQYKVLSARNIDELMAHLGEKIPSIVIASVDEQVDGLELTTSLSKDLDDGYLSLILTGHKLDGTDQSLLTRLGVSSVLVKPCSPTDVEASIKNAVAKLNRI